MKQYDLFGAKGDDEENKYTVKIKAPIYEPKNKKPHILELYDKTKTLRLIQEIDRSSLTYEEKFFLVDAARRHNVFNYEKIADYYAHASKEMQTLMERSALVIIDFDKALHYGYVKLSYDVSQQFLKEKYK
tara:strand:+ start:2329 stop:2721 length:393 start_codon:yes stop_codon:yes gene_type:complete